MEDGGRAGRLRSFALGGIVGAAGAIATGRRLAQVRRSGGPPRGLAAFEDAPCFLELVGEEAQRRREERDAGAGALDLE
jgi:hypothetical protein